jgi:hypothetical protein
VSRARELAAAAVANLDVDAERSILLAIEAVDTTALRPEISDIEQGVRLATALARGQRRLPETSCRGAVENVRSASPSPPREARAGKGT